MPGFSIIKCYEKKYMHMLVLLWHYYCHCQSTPKPQSVSTQSYLLRCRIRYLCCICFLHTTIQATNLLMKWLSCQAGLLKEFIFWSNFRETFSTWLDIFQLHTYIYMEHKHLFLLYILRQNKSKINSCFCFLQIQIHILIR